MDVKKDVNSGGGPKLPKIGDANSSMIWLLLGSFALGAVIYNNGYQMGCNTANKILRRHDKDERKLKKDFKTRIKEFKQEWVP